MFLGSFGAFALFFHLCFESIHFHGKAVGGGNGFCQVDGKTVGIVQFESVIAGNDLWLPLLSLDGFDRILQHAAADRQGLAKTLCFDRNNMQNMFFIRFQFRVHMSHVLDDLFRHDGQEGLFVGQCLPEVLRPA